MPFDIRAIRRKCQQPSGTCFSRSRPPESGSAEYEQLMASVGEAYRAAGVRAIYLVHGTFAGDDPVGLIRIVERVAPGSARRLRQAEQGPV